MTKIKYGSQLWTLFIIFSIVNFLLSAVAKASIYYFGIYILDTTNINLTLLYGSSYLLSQILYSFIFKFFLTYVLQKCVNKRIMKLVGLATKKINNMSVKYYDHDLGSGKYLSSLSNSFYGPYYYSAMQVYYLIDIVLILLLNLGFFFYFNWILGLITLSGIIVLLIVPKFFYKSLLYYHLKYNDQTNNWFEKMSQFFKLFALYFVSCCTNKIINKTQEKYKETKLTEKKLNDNFIAFDIITQSILFICQILYYLISGFVIVKTNNNIGQIVGLSFFSISSLPEVLNKATSFTGTFSDFFTKKSVYVKFWTFADGDQYPESQLIQYEKPFQTINFKNLSFNYPNNKPLFNKFNLTIQKDKKYLVIGNNGSGKSTLTKLFTGFERDYSGNILLNNDIEIKELKQASLCRYFNWVTNKNILLDDTLRNNLTLYKDQISDDQIRSSLAAMNLSDLNQLDHKYEEGQNGLSVGQVQRLDIARCLLEPKPILVLDEALSNVDVVNQERILNHFLSQKDLTLIVITHHLTAEWQHKFDQVVQL